MRTLFSIIVLVATFEYTATSLNAIDQHIDASEEGINHAWLQVTAPIFESLDPDGVFERTPDSLAYLYNICNSARYDVMRSGHLLDCYNDKLLPSRRFDFMVTIERR